MKRITHFIGVRKGEIPMTGPFKPGLVLTVQDEARRSHEIEIEIETARELMLRLIDTLNGIGVTFGGSSLRD